jgi:CRP-like cAMP-binding protein
MSSPRVVPSSNRTQIQASHEYLATTGPRKTILNVRKGELIFRQGDSAPSIFYLQKGRVKISVTSPEGKEATLALHNDGGFFGEECIAEPHRIRLTTAAALAPSTVLRIEREEMRQAMISHKSLADLFQAFLLTRCRQMQADLVDHIFNSSEKRLARTLLILAQLENGNEATIQHITQETLAEMIGTTRSRVSFFMNRFRKMGHIKYNGHSGVKVYSSLRNFLLHDQGGLCRQAAEYKDDLAGFSETNVVMMSRQSQFKSAPFISGQY